MRALLIGLSMSLLSAHTYAYRPTDRLTLERVFGSPALSGPTPRMVKVAPDGSRVGFLRGRTDDQHQLDLWEYNLADDTVRLLVDSKQLVPAEQVSDAEKARRERERTADLHGIVDYSFSPDGKSLLFPLGGELYLYDIAAANLRQLTHGDGAAIDPKVSPRGGYVSFLRDQNLVVIDLASGETRRLTDDGGGTVHNAEADFLDQEEFAQRAGYWWAPDDSAIAYKHYDDAPVPLARRFEIYADRTEVVEQRYPYAGAANPKVGLRLVSPRGGAIRAVDLGADEDIYLVRVNWLPDGKSLAFQRLSRNQQRLELVRVDVGSLAQSTLLTETSKTWIDLSDDLHFLKTQPAFVWSSDQSGTRQLELVGMDGRRRPLTRGGGVVDAVKAVDEAAGRVYFTSNRDDVAERQLYAARLDGRDADQPRRISQGAGLHDPAFAEGGDAVRLYVDTYSDPATPPRTRVHAADGKPLAWIEENRLDVGLGGAHPYAPYLAQHRLPEFGTLKAADGQTLNYRLYTPPGFDAARRYPVFVRVYGGPHVQMAQRAWPNLLDEYMAQQGYVVFSLDNRGSARRERRFTDANFHRFGEVEVQDQLAGIRWLKAQPFVDPARIGVFGWSFGGYMTLMLLGKGGAEIAAGAAGAPVTDWSLYDSAYTERYLGNPRDNAEGYRLSSVFSALSGMKAPLLLVHGMADDNVLFTNSTRLMSDLQARGVPFRLMTYPGAKHGLSSPSMKVHAYTTIKDFFAEYLKPEAPPAD